MRTIAQIKQEMTTAFVDDAVIVQKYGLTPGLTFEQQFSKVSIENIIFYIVAVCIWSLEQILEISIGQQNEYIKQIKIHSFTWYSMYAKKFEYGLDLPWGEVEYDNSGLTAQQVEAMQVVKFASCSKTPGGLMVKIAGLDGSGNLVPIPNGAGGTADMFTPFKEYMFRISAAGDTLFYTNAEADDLKLELTVYYDPLVLDSTGKRLDGTADTPVADAIEAYVKGMDFDGLLVPTFLTDALQQVEGVKIPVLSGCWSRYGVGMPWMAVPMNGVNPFAGYCRIKQPSDLTIIYIAG